MKEAKASAYTSLETCIGIAKEEEDTAQQASLSLDKKIAHTSHTKENKPNNLFPIIDDVLSCQTAIDEIKQEVD